jgi:hypothetical protein
MCHNRAYRLLRLCDAMVRWDAKAKTSASGLWRVRSFHIPASAKDDRLVPGAGTWVSSGQGDQMRRRERPCIGVSYFGFSRQVAASGWS